MSEHDYNVYPRVQEVILTSVPRGAGKDHSDPCRTVLQVHHKDGEFLAEYDPVVNMEKLTGRLRRAESLLRDLVAQVSPGGIAEIRKLAEDFLDPEPL